MRHRNNFNKTELGNWNQLRLIKWLNAHITLTEENTSNRLLKIA